LSRPFEPGAKRIYDRAIYSPELLGEHRIGKVPLSYDVARLKMLAQKYETDSARSLAYTCRVPYLGKLLQMMRDKIMNRISILVFVYAFMAPGAE